MSNVRVGKHRRGFMLRNQQLKKSVPESVNDAEADGTLIAIKLKTSCEQMMENCSAVRDQLSNLNDDVVENALAFKTAPESCLANGDPVEKVWLDHSVIYVNMEHLCGLLGKECKPSFPKNLIVVNMGSVVNSGVKNWNTQFIPKQSLINEYDRKVYEIVQKYNPGKLPDYPNIFGSAMLEVTDSALISTYGKGVDNVEIESEGNGMKTDIDAAISELMSRLRSQNGGRRRKSLKQRRGATSRKRGGKKQRRSRQKKRFFFK
jgi:hypothetical protein